MENFSNEKFYTPNLIVRNLIRCLSNDNKILNQIDFDTIYDTSLINKIIKTKFKRSSYIKKEE